jgi:hypothetical protein
VISLWAGADWQYVAPIIATSRFTNGAFSWLFNAQVLVGRLPLLHTLPPMDAIDDTAQSSANVGPPMTEDQNPVPKGFRSFRASVDDSISRRDQEMWKRARLFIRNITSRYVNASSQVEPILQGDIRNLWYLFIGAAKVTPTDEAAADRLAVQVLVAREMGTLKTISEDAGNNMPLSAAHDSPRIWTELPCLVTDLRTAWVEAIETSNSLPPDQLANLAGFTARLVAYGICEAELSQCCLLLLRAALETPRRVPDSEDTAEVSDMPFSYFMPALLAWFRHGSYKLFCLCARGAASKLEVNNTSQAEDRWVVAGSLLSASSPAPTQELVGFSMVRWEFWKQRLDDIAKLYMSSSNKELEEDARHCYRFLDTWEDITGGNNHDRALARKVYFDID